jgi:YafQ family addiction module toxin component
MSYLESKMFEFDVSEELKLVMAKLAKRDRNRLLALRNKMAEIISNSYQTIDHYHNCIYSLKEYKHVHIDKSFVLFFKVCKQENRILFAFLGHHDAIFKK